MATLLETLADFEHQQWAHWTRYMLDNLTPENIERWRRQIETPYSELSEDEKDSDREWAQKTFKLIGDYLTESWHGACSLWDEVMQGE